MLNPDANPDIVSGFSHTLAISPAKMAREKS